MGLAGSLLGGFPANSEDCAEEETRMHIEAYSARKRLGFPPGGGVHGKRKRILDTIMVLLCGEVENVRIWLWKTPRRQSPGET